jgi:hypothetical protein
LKLDSDHAMKKVEEKGEKIRPKNYQPYVIILSSDERFIEKFHKILRSRGYIPQLFQDLGNFFKFMGEDWFRIFCLADGTLLSQGELSFFQHPLFEKKRLHCLFILTKEHYPLRKSIMSCQAGAVLLEEDRELVDYTVSIELGYYEYGLGELKKHIQSFEHQYREIKAEDHKRFQKTKEQQSLLGQWEEDKRLSDGKNFPLFLSTWVTRSKSFIKSFALLEVDGQQQKVSSSLIQSDRYHQLGTLWILDGKSQQLQDDIEQKYWNKIKDKVQGKVFRVKLGKRISLPHFFLLLEFDTEFSLTPAMFLYLEKYFQEMYQKCFPATLELKIEEDSVEQKPWEMLSDVERYMEKTLDYNFKLVVVDFIPLIQMVQTLAQGEFLWNKYYQDLTTLASSVNHLFMNYSFFGLEKMVFLVQKDVALNLAKILEKKFAMMKPNHYVELDQSGTKELYQQMNPGTKIYPCSPQALFSQMIRFNEIQDETRTQYFFQSERQKGNDQIL